MCALSDKAAHELSATARLTNDFNHDCDDSSVFDYTLIVASDRCTSRPVHWTAGARRRVGQATGPSAASLEEKLSTQVKARKDAAAESAMISMRE